MDTDRKIACVIVLIAVGASLTLTLLGAAGVRGSDQYWYTAEVDQILAGRINESNVVFPFHAIRGLVPPPFNHHTPIHYLVVPFAALLDPYRGWIVLNGLCSLASACLIGLLAGRIRGLYAGTFAFVLSLLLPLVFWVTLQPYLASSVALFVSLALWIYVGTEDSLGKWIALSLLFAAASLSLFSFLPLLLFVPAGYLTHARPLSVKKLLMGVVMLASVPAVLLIQQEVLRRDPALTLQRYVAASVPGVSDNMHVLYSLEDDPLEAWKLWRKLAQGVWKQFGPLQSTTQLFYLPFNLMACATLAFLFQDRSRYRIRMRVAVILVLGLHFVTVFLRDNEFRFLHQANPLVLCGSALFLASTPLLRSRGRWVTATLAAMLVLGSVNLFLAFHLRQQARQEEVLRTRLGTIFTEAISPKESVVLGVRGFSASDLLVGYVLRPRLVLFVDNSYNYTRSQLETMTGNVQGKWLFSHYQSPLLDKLHLLSSQPFRQDFPPPYDEYALYRLK